MNRMIFALCFALLCLIQTGCQNERDASELPNDEAGVVDTEPPVVDYSLHCEDTFKKIWCSQNLLASSILEVCIGEIPLDERSLNAISLVTSEGEICYIESQVEGPANLPGCANAIAHQFVADLQGASPFSAVICRASGGQAVYIEGESSLKESFRAMNIE